MTGWDEQAATFDDEADHGLADPQVHAAWARLLRDVVPGGPQRIADLGCGTGSLAVLLAADGHTVTGLDSSPAMLDLARAKADRLSVDVRWLLHDIAAPDLPARSFDVVLCRHVVWALPDPRASLAAWTDLLAPDGWLVLVEGHWGTAGQRAGLQRTDLVAMLDDRLAVRQSQDLPDPRLWGRPVDDERYVVVAGLRRAP